MLHPAVGSDEEGDFQVLPAQLLREIARRNDQLPRFGRPAAATFSGAARPRSSPPARTGSSPHAAPGAGNAAERRRAVDAVEESSIRGGTHAIAVQIGDFGPGRANRLQRSVLHVDTEYIDAASLR